MQVGKRGQRAMLPQSIFVANDWPTGLLPLQLLAWQRGRSASVPSSDSLMQQVAPTSLALTPTAEVGEGGAQRTGGSSQLHDVPAQLEVFHRLKQLPDATPDVPVWQDAHFTLQEMLREPLVTAKVCPPHELCCISSCIYVLVPSHLLRPGPIVLEIM